MDCLICGGSMGPYFSKQFNAFELSNVDYWRCSQCGFVISKTHLEMSIAQWGILNESYHGSYHGSDSCPDDRNWLKRITTQAKTITSLHKLGILGDTRPWVDWGCGDGKLANLIDKYSSKQVLKYDKYPPEELVGQMIDEVQLYSQKYSLVINCSVLEHVVSLDPIQNIFNLVDKDGVLAVHTLVCEEIPRDPDWFYLLPVHCAFFSNKSMDLLFQRFGFKASFYHVESRMWFWFRDVKALQYADKLNQVPGTWSYKEGFMDYWK